MDADWGEMDGPVLAFGGPVSNLHAVRALRRGAEAAGIASDHVICTGDLAAYCGQPAETVAEIRDWGCRVVAGNCERELAARSGVCGCGFAEGSACDALSGEWFAHADAALTDEVRAWMAGLPDRAVFCHRGAGWAVIHGGAAEIARFHWPGVDGAAKAADVAALEAAFARPLAGVICGHAGLAFFENVAGRVWLNAGAVGMPPNDGAPATRYAVLDGAARIERLTYDAAGAAAAMAGRASPYADTLLSGVWPSEDVLPEALRRAS